MNNENSALMRCWPSNSCQESRIRFRDHALSGLHADDAALAGDLAHEQGADRIPLEERVEQVPHPDLVPDLVALDEGQVPHILVVAAAPAHEVPD